MVLVRTTTMPLAVMLSLLPIIVISFLVEVAAYTITTPQAEDNPWTRLGAADDSHPVTFTMTLRGEHFDELHDKMQDIALQRGSWLTSEQLSYYVKPSSEALAAVQTFLGDRGLVKDAVKFGRHQNTLTVKTDARTAAEIFATDVHLYRDAQTSAIQAKTTKVTIPDNIAPHVTDVRGFNTFGHHPVAHARGDNARRLRTENSSPSSTFPDTGTLSTPRDEEPPQIPSFPSGPSAVHEPPPGCSDQNVSWPCLARFYGYEGYNPPPKSESLAVIANEAFHDDTILAFEENFRRDAIGFLPNKAYLGNNHSSWDHPPASEDEETTLDTEIIIAIGYPLNLTVYLKSPGFVDMLQSIIELPDDERPGVVSSSYGWAEKWDTLEGSIAMCQAVQQLAALGTTFTAACGDSGVGYYTFETCPPFTAAYLCSCPYTLSVGSTMNFHEEKAAYSRRDPTNLYKGWSSGGFSNRFEPLPYQKQALQAYLSRLEPSLFEYFNASGRGFVDISAQGQYINCWLDGKFTYEGGQSASSPAVAAMLALVNSKCKEKGKSRIGWVHPVLYAHPESINDVTIGGAYKCGNTTLGLPSAPGWDPATGLGSPHFPNLVKAFGCD